MRNWSTSLRTYVIAFISMAALAVSACSDNESSPTGPTPTAAAPSSESAPPSSNGPGALSVSISPNPVPWSSEPVPNCNLANRWHYEQTLMNSGGTRLTISDRADFFDGVEVSKRSGLGIVLAPGADTKITTQWCSANNIAHTAKTNFSGSDDSGNRVTFDGSSVRLQPK